MIIEAALSAAALFSGINWLFMHYEKDLDFFKEPGLADMRRKIAEHLDEVAKSVVRKHAPILRPPKPWWMRLCSQRPLWRIRAQFDRPLRRCSSGHRVFKHTRVSSIIGTCQLLHAPWNIRRTVKHFESLLIVDDAQTAQAAAGSDVSRLERPLARAGEFGKRLTQWGYAALAVDLYRKRQARSKPRRMPSADDAVDAGSGAIAETIAEGS